MPGLLAAGKLVLELLHLPAIGGAEAVVFAAMLRPEKFFEMRVARGGNGGLLLGIED